ncbi:hypothetical protein VNO77_26864 [Canavalia gladiata]|uniref:Uncharacterized protein n=1 Tax=Canavalia gladiata TaxID=3824 RepID=A0AAN9KVV7_CANGL
MSTDGPTYEIVIVLTPKMNTLDKYKSKRHESTMKSKLAIFDPLSNGEGALKEGGSWVFTVSEALKSAFLSFHLLCIAEEGRNSKKETAKFAPAAFEAIWNPLDLRPCLIMPQVSCFYLYKLSRVVVTDNLESLAQLGKAMKHDARTQDSRPGGAKRNPLPRIVLIWVMCIQMGHPKRVVADANTPFLNGSFKLGQQNQNEPKPVAKRK